MAGSSRALIRALDNVFSGWKGGTGIANGASATHSTTVATSPNERSNSNIPTYEDTPEIAELLSTITEFHEKHNTLQSIKQSANLNDELFRIYDAYVKPTSNLGKEIFFLEILTQLWPFFIEDEPLAWLNTYLKPAVDSAGFDLQFVHRSRKFIQRMTTNIMHTDDPLLAERREKIGISVIDKIVKVYLGEDTSLGKIDQRRSIILIKDKESEVNTQEFSENLRYIKMNCTNIIIEYGLKNTKSLISILDTYLARPSDRLGALTLLSDLVSNEASQTYEIVNSSLFGSLLKSLANDENENLIAVTLSILCMIIPQACDKIGRYLSDLFAIYMRIVERQQSKVDSQLVNKDGELDEISESDIEADRDTDSNSEQTRTEQYSQSHQIKKQEGLDTTSSSKPSPKKVDDWEVCPSDPISPVGKTLHLNYKIDFDSQCLITLLYGLFPFNLTKFGQDPIRFLSKYPARLVKVEYTNYSIGPKENCTASALTTEKVNSLLKRFTFHPSFLEFDRASLQSEIKSPIKWLLEEKNEDEDLRAEEIALGCLSLNPELIITIPDSLMEQPIHGSYEKSFSIGRHPSNFNFSSRSDLQQLQHSYESRSSSLGGPIYINAKEENFDPELKSQFQKYLFNVTRRASMVPSSLVDHTNSNSGTTRNSIRNFSGHDIRFKEVSYDDVTSTPTSAELNFSNDSSTSNMRDEKYGGNNGSNATANTITNLQNIDDRSNEALSDLFAIHEKLYSSASKYALAPGSGSGSIAPSVSKRSSYTLQSPLVPSFEKSTDLLPLQPHQSQLSHQSNLSNQDGTAIDFYQRELLLMKNELDFSNYMQQLNKFQYAKLKLKMNRVQREADLHLQSSENRNNVIKIENLRKTCTALGETIHKLQSEIESSMSKSKSEIVGLLEKQKQIYDENKELKRQLQVVNDEMKEYESGLTQVKKHLIPEKDIEISGLRARLRELELEKTRPNLDVSTHTTPAESPLRGEDLESSRDSSEYFDRPAQLGLSEQERKIKSLRTEILMANERNAEVKVELAKLQDLFEISTKNYEQKISALKHEIGSNASSFVSQYERRIQELTATILKYEGIIEMKNTKIVQLSTSKPISIPISTGGGSKGAIPTTVVSGGISNGGISVANNAVGNPMHIQYNLPRHPSNGMQTFDGDSQSRSNSSVDTVPSPPHQMNGTGSGSWSIPSTPQSGVYQGFHFPPAIQNAQVRTNSSTSSNLQPIIKGRGGYQKRSKKHM